ncbi:squalene monooxygenase SE1-like isoform X1 [Vigna umbellata]|uniref:squalene monooxygenase SE1-like isoform X1 n=2 Tax=Vigna umbellata TaxID=87088 RepID=UPI001F5E608E|nr:squalene monooxygenase SE1-like isoform X1 [Vigna umbellata]
MSIIVPIERLTDHLLLLLPKCFQLSTLSTPQQCLNLPSSNSVNNNFFITFLSSSLRSRSHRRFSAQQRCPQKPRQIHLSVSSAPPMSSSLVLASPVPLSPTPSPSVRMEQGTVTSLLEQDNKNVVGVQYRTKDGQQLKAYAPLTVICDGCFSNLRRSLCHPKVEVPSSFVGLVLENCQLPFENYGHVILADPSPILFYRISSTEVRCLVDIPGPKVPLVRSGIANYLKATVASQIPLELKDAFLSAIDRGNIRIMPNSSMPAEPYHTPGALLIGDAFNMRHPLTGGGMTVALSDIVLLRDLIKPVGDLNDASSLCRYLESFYILRKPMASTINTLAGALYKVFSVSPDDARKELRQACFDYVSLGKIFSGGPIALLSGLNPYPLSLVLHFFAVAFYGVGRLLLPFPSFERMWVGARIVLCAFGIIFPIIKAEGIRQMFLPTSIPAFYRAPPLR